MGRAKTTICLAGCIAALLAVFLDAQAQDAYRRAPASPGEIRLSYAPLVKNTAPALAEEMELDAMEGVVITKVRNGSYASQFVAPGDVVLSVNGTEVTEVRQLAALLFQARRSWKISVRRGGQTLSISVRM